MDNSNMVKAKKKNYDIVVIFLLCLLPRLIISLQTYPVLYPSDEVSSFSAPAMLAGYDWSAVVSHAGYYGFGFLFLFAPLFKMGMDPVWIYRIIQMVLSVMEAGCSIICYAVIPCLFSGISRKKRNLITLSSSLLTAASTLTMGEHNEATACFLVWCTLYLLAHILAEKGKTKIKHEVILLLLLAWSLTIHSRLLMLHLCLLLISAVTLIMYGKLPFHLFFYVGLAAVYLVTQKVTDAYRGLIWNTTGSIKNASATDQVGMFLPFIREHGFSWDVVGYAAVNVLGQIYTAFVFTGGALALAVSASVISWFPLKRKHKMEKSDIMFICELFLICCALGQIAGTTVSWMPGYFNGSAYSTKAITYLRYFGPYLPPLMMLGLLRVEMNPARRKQFVRGMLVLMAVLTVLWYWKIWPIVNEGGRQHGDMFFAFMSGVHFGQPVLEANYLQAGLIAMEIALLFAVLFSWEKETFAYLLLSFILLSTRADQGSRTISSGFRVYQTADGGYRAIQAIRREMPVDQIHMYDTSARTNHQTWYLYQYLNYDVRVIPELPDIGDKGILFTDGKINIDRDCYGYVRLGSNEYAYCLDPDTAMAFRNAGYEVLEMESP